jgi:radical SAM superfamily enzyme YgiQ (UPF0313 family)
MGNWETWGKHTSVNVNHAQLAAFVRSRTKSVQVQALDGKVLGLTEEELFSRVESISPDAVYMGTILVEDGGAATIVHFNETFRKIKERSPGTVTIAGGLMYSALPEKLMNENPWIDYVLIGDGEPVLLELMEQLHKESPNLEGIKGLGYRKGGEVMMTPPRPLLPNLDELPMPAYDLFPMDRYVGYSRIQNYNQLAVSRGCVGTCSFCYEWWLYDPRKPKDFTSFRFRSGEKIVDELEILNKEYGVKLVHFFDDDFNGNRERVEVMCNEIVRRGLDISWFCMGRAVNWVRDQDLLPLMRKAGCYMVLLGIEGARDEDFLQSMKLGNFGHVKLAVDSLRKNDIATVGTYLFGFWDDDEEIIKRRIQFVDEVDPDIAAPQILIPIPGSPIYRKAMEMGVIQEDDYKYWDTHHPVMPTKHLSREDVGRLAAWANREFFSKAGRIQRIMSGYSSPYVRLVFQSYMENATSYEGAAKEMRESV